ncbi:protein TolQ [bacterium]|nr:MAG: protein TolQ [bacterium]
MVSGAGPMVKLVLLVLLAFSIISWAIIIYKLILLRKMEKENAAFSTIFWDKRQFPQVYALSKGFKRSTLAALFNAVYVELANSPKTPDKPRFNKDDIERLQRILKKSINAETARLEYAVTFLATAGNTAPFIGLFGTVWGIMSAFRNIGAKGAANLATVAPGISEALVATAMGLAVAIPAVMGYNHILSKMNRITAEMDGFCADLVNIIEKYY